MPRPIGTTGTAPAARKPRPRRRQPRQPRQPAPASNVFREPITQRPFAPQQRQAAARTRAAVRRLPQPVVAAPPVIHNPSPAQVRHAARQISSSLTRAVGTSGTNAEKIARRDMIVAQVRTDPRLARVRKSLNHWQREQAKLVRPGAVARPGPAPTRVRLGVGPFQLATVNVSQLGQKLGNAFAAATPGLHAGTAEAQFARNALGDVKTLASAPFIGGYELGSVGADVVTGHPGRAAGKVERFGKGVVQGTIRDWSHPDRYFRQHPLLFALDVAGAGSVVGRTAGAIARGAGSTVEAAGVRGALARAGSTRRLPVALTEDVGGGVVERRASKDLLRASIQRTRDKSREVITDEHGTPVAVRPRSELERARLTKRRADLLASRTNLSERLARDVASKEAKIRGVRGQHARNTVAMVAEGTITSAKHFERDLRAHVDRLKGRIAQHDTEYKATGHSGVFQHEGELERARQRVKTGEAILNNPRALAQQKQIAAAGIEHGRQLVTHDTEAAGHGLIDAQQARRARLVVAAVEHMGARHGRSAKLTAQSLEARRIERSLRARLNFGHNVPSKAMADAAEQGLKKARARLDAIDKRMARLQQDYHNAEALGGLHAADQVMADIETLNADRVEAFHLVDRLDRQHKLLSGPRKKLEGQIQQVREMRRGIVARNTERLRDAQGNPLEPQHIEEFLRSRGRDPSTVAYLPTEVTRRQFHKQFRPEQGRGVLDTGKGPRTGQQHLKGATEASAELIRAAGVRQATALNKARSIDRLISEYGMRHPAFSKAEKGVPLSKHEQRVVNAGGYFNGKEAAQVVARAGARGERLVALRAYPAKLDSETQRMIRDDLQGPAAMETLGQRLLNNRFLSEDELKSKGARNVVVANADLIDRLGKHLKPSGGLGKFGQILNRAFRYAVLPQPRWLAGNFIEPLLFRMPGVASGINVFGLGVDLIAATRIIRTAERSSDPAVRAAAQEIRAHQFGGLLIGGRGQTIHRGLEDFPALSAEVQKYYGRIISRMPAVRQMSQLSGMLLRHGGRAVLAPLDLIFHLNRLGESVLQRAAFGKSVRRDIQEFTGSWTQTVMLGQKAAEEAANRLVNTSTQHRFMDAQHELLGKYEGFSPQVRALIQGAAPFIPWALNAARFVLWTMPAHRSAQTALLIRVQDVVSKDWQQIHKNVPPGMGLAIPTKSGGWVDVARYTPYGLTAPVAEGELQGLTGQFFPQFSGIQNAAQGKDPFGRDLKLQSGNKPGLSDKVAIAANEGAEALVPYLSTARRLMEHGETPYADSSIIHPRTKPGTSHGMSAARRVFDPFRPTYLTAGASVASGPAPRSRISREEQILRAASAPTGSGRERRREEQILRAASGR